MDEPGENNSLGAIPATEPIVALEWDAVTVRDRQGTHASFGRIYITNNGRRPVYITSAGVEVVVRRPQGSIRQTTQGKDKGRKLSEGDPPLCLIVGASGATADLLTTFRYAWQEFRAFAIDSTGRRYVSPRTKRRPSWGAGDGRTPRGISGPAHIVECDLEQHDFESHIVSGDFILMRHSEVRKLKEETRGYGIDTSKLDGALEEAKHVVTTIHRPKHGPDP